MRLRFLPCVLVLVAATAPTARAQKLGRPGPPVAVKQETRDGVSLAFTYYPSNEGKNATPVVILHDYKDTQGMFGNFALRLQSPTPEEKRPSFAVVTVDLRGHGGSTKQFGGGDESREIDPSKLGRDDFDAMTTQDMETVRKYLVTQNDEGNLNLNKLCIVGVGLGASVAVNWAAEDWAAPPLLVGKQGQDVKALVLLTPRWKYKGVMVQQALRGEAFKQQVAWMLIAGKDDSAGMADAKRIFKPLERYHPEPQSGAGQATPRGLELVELASSLQGGRLFSQAGAQVENQVIQFLTTHVASHDLPWSQRRNRIP